MILLLIQIVLTVIAWRKGWKWYSLIPLLGAIFIGLIIGISVGSNGGSVNNVQGLTIFLDIVTTIILAILCVKSPNNEK